MDLVGVEEHAAAPGVRWQPGDAWLAGGTWLFSEPQPEIRRLLDLHAFDWPALTVRDDVLEIAATCTIAELAAWDGPGAELVRRCCDALLGSFKVWNAATVGGNLCLALPAAPMAALAVATDAVLTTSRREIAAVNFVTGVQQTALEPGEYLRSVRVPLAALRAPSAFRQASLTPLGRSAALVIRVGDRFTITASVPRPVVLTSPVVPDLDWYDDPHGTPAWRAHMTRRLVAECA